MKRVLVTGADGFIGSHLIEGLVRAGPEMRAFVLYNSFYPWGASGDVAEPATWKGLPAADVVVRLAARSFVPDSWKARGGFLRTNLTGTVEALKYCRAHCARVRVRDLEPRWDYVYVLDVVERARKSGGPRARMRNVQRCRHKPLSRGSHTDHSADVGTDLPVPSDGVRRQDEIMDTVADVSRAEELLGWKPRFTLRQGIEALHAAV